MTRTLKIKPDSVHLLAGYGFRIKELVWYQDYFLIKHVILRNLLIQDNSRITGIWNLVYIHFPCLCYLGLILGALINSSLNPVHLSI